MEIFGTYLNGFTPAENIECKIKINNYGIEIYPSDPSIYNKVKQPKEKEEYLLKKFIGDKRFPYTWIIEYKDCDDETRKILTKINSWEVFNIKRIKGVLLYQKFTSYEYIIATIIAIILNLLSSLIYEFLKAQ